MLSIVRPARFLLVALIASAAIVHAQPAPAAAPPPAILAAPLQKVIISDSDEKTLAISADVGGDSKVI
ncbi:MAG: hypothetical protein RLZZ15_3740, partial [Verrucomicrobiota bacterium]